MLKIILNEDEEMVKMIKEGLVLNCGYCPCLLTKDEDTKCMCKQFREQQTEGYCHCGLYKKVFVDK